MGNVGQVKFIIYFGTMFDDINVPYFNDLIRTTATKKLSFPVNMFGRILGFQILW